jgi:Flp pilus assembly protein TadG
VKILHSRGDRGQSVTEFALLLPIMLLMTAVVVDVARMYQVWITLESATRDAAEYVATTQTSSSAAQTEARRVVCLAGVGLPGFSSAGNNGECASPSVTVSSFSRTTTGPGATSRYPIASVRVQTAMVFQTALPYPFLTNGGTWTVRSEASYSIVQGR